MLAVLLITVLFVVLCIYFYFRAEKLQRELLLLKREVANTQKENASLSKSMALIASSHEDFTKTRLNMLLANKEQISKETDLDLLKPLINNYAVIFRECLTSKGKMQGIIKKCFNNQDNEVFKEFSSKFIKADKKLQRLWGSNNIAGFISMVETLLIKYEEDKSN